MARSTTGGVRMRLSNTATPRYYGQFRDAVLRGEIPVNNEISMQMNRIDDRIRNPKFYYDEDAVEGFIPFLRTRVNSNRWFRLTSFRLI